MKLINLKTNFSDDRGQITDLFENENINAATHISFSKNAVRANHYHKETTQYNFVISGSIRLVTQMNDDEPKETILRKGSLAITLPYEKHALQALEESELLVFTRGPRAGSEYETDTFRLDIPLI